MDPQELSYPRAWKLLGTGSIIVELCPHSILTCFLHVDSGRWMVERGVSPVQRLGEHWFQRISLEDLT